MERICLHQQIPELGEAEQGGQSRNLMATCVAFRDLSDRHINMGCHLLLQWNLEPIELELSQRHPDNRHRSEPPGDLRLMTNMRRYNSVYTEESTIEIPQSSPWTGCRSAANAGQALPPRSFCAAVEWKWEWE